MRRRLSVTLAMGLVTSSALVLVGRAQQPVSFTKDVLPILSSRCLKCHGKDLQLSKLDLRSRATLLKGGEHGVAVVPGDAESSRLYRMVSGAQKPAMPLDGKLSDAQVIVLREWINQGAIWEGNEITVLAPSGLSSPADPEEMEILPSARQYWAFHKPVRPPLPRLKHSEWSQHPVDAFLMQLFEEKGMTPAPPTDRASLARRAYLDLTCLPPSPEEVQAFINDSSADAWGKLLELPRVPTEGPGPRHPRRRESASLRA